MHFTNTHTHAHMHNVKLVFVVACFFRYNYCFSVARRLFYFHSISFALECIRLCVCVYVYNFCSQRFMVYATLNVWCSLPFSLGPVPIDVCVMFVFACVLYCHCSYAKTLVNMYVMPHWCVQCMCNILFLE